MSRTLCSTRQHDRHVLVAQEEEGETVFECCGIPAHASLEFSEWRQRHHFDIRSL
jgi:hypothetical protein